MRLCVLILHVGVPVLGYDLVFLTFVNLSVFEPALASSLRLFVLVGLYGLTLMVSHSPETLEKV